MDFPPQKLASSSFSPQTYKPWIRSRPHGIFRGKNTGFPDRKPRCSSVVVPPRRIERRVRYRGSEEQPGKTQGGFPTDLRIWLKHWENMLKHVETLVFPNIWEFDDWNMLKNTMIQLIKKRCVFFCIFKQIKNPVAGVKRQTFSHITCFHRWVSQLLLIWFHLK